jgi:hypothetical protein
MSILGSIMSNKVLRHPDKEEIIKRLLDGTSVKEVESWLKKKHTGKKRLHISYMTLQKFRSESLNLKGDVLDDIKNRRAEIGRESDDSEARSLVLGSSDYKDMINEIASSELDVTRRLLEMDKLITSRIEYYYNLLQSGGSIKEDKVFLEYVNTLRSLMQDWKKYIDGVADKTVEHSVNINVINDQALVLKEIVYEILEDMSPELIPIFVDRMNRKLGAVSYDTDEYKSYINADYSDA